MAAVDNLDHNQTATGATTSFHGTDISMFQPFIEKDTCQAHAPLIFLPNSTKQVKPLPAAYSSIEPVSKVSCFPKVPTVVDSIPSNNADAKIK